MYVKLTILRFNVEQKKNIAKKSHKKEQQQIYKQTYLPTNEKQIKSNSNWNSNKTLTINWNELRNI